MDHVINLVITPFRLIVEKGNVAARNSELSQPMLRAAGDLAKEGERALKCLAPICWKYFDEYGLHFVDALREHAEIRRYREGLNDLLYDFDDYVVADGFVLDRYVELQALTRCAAPKIYDCILRLKIATPVRDETPLSPPCSPPLSQPVSPLLQLSLQSPSNANYLDRIREPAASTYDDLEVMSTTSATEELKKLLQGHISNEPQRIQTYPYRSDWESAASRQPPTSSSASLLDSPVTRSFSNGDSADFNVVDNETARPESPIDPFIEQSSPDHRWQSSPTNFGSDTASCRDPDRDEAQAKAASCAAAMAFPPGSSTDMRPPHPTGMPGSRTINMSKPLPSLASLRYSPKKALPLSPRSGSQGRTSDECSSVSSGPWESRGSSVAMMPQDQELSPPTSPETQHKATPQLARRLRSTQGRIYPRPMMPLMEVDPGLIPVNSEPSDVPRHNASARKYILTPSDSFHLYKGFCQGAEEVLKGEIGVKKMQKPVRRTLSRVVARCTGCLYELDFNKIEEDVHNHEDGNMIKNGIGYRLRFLQKSHIAAKRVDDVPFGCVFCVHQGYTLDRSDATVFFSTKALFDHLARHPRPLPQIPGLCVVEGAEIPAQLRNNYDLHLRQPPAPHPAHENHDEVSNRPSGLAKQHSRRLFGQKLIYDRSPALELALGARVTGIQWPLKYKGEWMFAWHDGIFASVPTDLIKLEPPPASEVQLGGSSRVCARARWKFAPKDKDAANWLKFDRHETITNILWPHAEHWCWSGINAKGKWGIFPRAFIDMDTVHEVSQQGAGQTSSPTMEKGKSSVLSKISGRRSSGRSSRRPSSIAESTSSRETMPPGLRLPSKSSKT
ncbi:hypothetical protein HIM_01382 [Hirsutella minnesotensis 3608]|nr:hypothetical protein HIM_01382 [Hirsutella minnesotensis 3608]